MLFRGDFIEDTRFDLAINGVSGRASGDGISSATVRHTVDGFIGFNILTAPVTGTGGAYTVVPMAVYDGAPLKPDPITGFHFKKMFTSCRRVEINYIKCAMK